MHKIHVVTIVSTVPYSGQPVPATVHVSSDVIEFETGDEAFTACGALNSRQIYGPENTKVTRTATYLGNR